MSEPKDPTIKLFGKTIPLSEIPTGSAGAPASSSGDLVDDSLEHSHASFSSNSSRESHTREEGVVDKVCRFWGFRISYFERHPLFEMLKKLIWLRH